VHLTTQGGSRQLLQHLIGKGDLKLRERRISRWDVNATWPKGHHEGASRWASGEGIFCASQSWIIFPGLRPDGSSEMTLLRHDEFAEDSDLRQT